MNIATFEELKLSGNLPTPAGIGVRILELTRTEEYSVEDMGEAIMADPSLTGRILQLANTGERSASKPATTVAESIMRLGSRTVRNLALAFSLVSERSTGACRTFQYETYWSASLGRAVAAQALARRIGEKRPEEAYICGLLGDVGRLALASVYAESYGALLAEHGSLPLDDMIPKENARFKIDHAQIGSLMLADWGLPGLFTEAIHEYASKRTLVEMEEIQNLGDNMRLSYWIAEALVADEYTAPFVWKTIGIELEHARRILGMNQEQFTSCCDAISKDWVQWGDTLDVSTGNGQRFVDVFRHVAANQNAKPEDQAAAEAGVSDSAALPEASEETAGTNGDGIRLMVIGVNGIGLAKQCAELQNGTYEIRTCESGKEGLSQALRWGADVVVTDEAAPGLNGMEVCKSLRSNEQNDGLYLMVVGSAESVGRGVKAFAAGADDFLEVPCPSEVLAARVQAGVRVCELQRKVEKDKATMMRQVAELGVLTRKLRATALTDALTNLPNRRYAMKRMESEWASVLRTGRNFSLVMLDVDHFKSVNDNHGHDVGDVVLKETAKIIQSAIRTSDEACRIGGEEFVIICKNTKEEDCMVVAERIRMAMEANVVKFGSFDGSVTASMGIAGFRADMTGPGELLKLADEAVYEAKHRGRNQSVAAADMKSDKKAA